MPFIDTHSQRSGRLSVSVIAFRQLTGRFIRLGGTILKFERLARLALHRQLCTAGLLIAAP
jgi:hypothetical protein